MRVTETEQRQTGDGHKDGRVVSIAGPVVDVEFPPGDIPEINTAVTMTVELEGDEIEITSEIAQHIGENRVRAVALKPTDGLRRGTPVHNSRPPPPPPVGPRGPGPPWDGIGEPPPTPPPPGTGGGKDPPGSPPPPPPLRD